jgi:large subunit ribosomal protein L18
MSKKIIELRGRRANRSRFTLKRKAKGRLRLSVFRSSKHIYAQIIDDAKGQTLAAASSLDEGVKGGIKTGADIAAAKAVGKLIAERAKEKKIDTVVFDRGRFLYHGRVKALADAAREAGLSF